MTSPVNGYKTTYSIRLPDDRIDPVEFSRIPPAEDLLNQAFSTLAQPQSPARYPRRPPPLQLREDEKTTPILSPSELPTPKEVQSPDSDTTVFEIEQQTKWICSSCGRESINPDVIDKHFWCDDNDRQLHPDEYLFPSVGRLCLIARRCFRGAGPFYNFSKPKKKHAQDLHHS